MEKYADNATYVMHENAHIHLSSDNSNRYEINHEI
jgi:hypothetical protein